MTYPPCNNYEHGAIYFIELFYLTCTNISTSMYSVNDYRLILTTTTFCSVILTHSHSMIIYGAGEARSERVITSMCELH